MFDFDLHIRFLFYMYQTMNLLDVADFFGFSLTRSFIEESQAGIKISPQDNNYFGVNDRLVTLTGTLDEQMRAADLILSKLSEDSHYTQSMNAPFSYPGVCAYDDILLIGSSL